jgi:hypothetical protein
MHMHVRGIDFYIFLCILNLLKKMVAKTINIISRKLAVFTLLLVRG